MINREKCLDLAVQFGDVETDNKGAAEYSFDTYGIEALINRAYQEGQRDMQDRIIKKLGSYDANSCAQIAASLEIK